MRLFVSLPVPADLAEATRPALSVQGFRPVPAGTWHMTLAFLGDADPTVVHRALDGLDVPAMEGRFTVAGAFPQPQKANVLWLGVQAAGLDALAQDVQGRLSTYLDGKRFVPHVTLGRFRRPTDARALLRHLVVPSQSLMLDEVHLMRSELTPDGPVHTSVATYAAGSR